MVSLKPAPHIVARVLAPAAMLLLLLGMTVAARVYYSTHPFKPGEAVLSNFENCEDNPRGYLAATAGTALACGLLLPAALLFRRALPGAWGASGAWIYGAGAASGIVMAALDPFLEMYHPVHIVLAFCTFLALIGGLGCVSIAAARARLRPGRGVWSAAAAVHFVVILIAIEVIPLPKRGLPGFWNSLAAGELALVALIGAGTASLAAAMQRPHLPASPQLK